MVITHCGGNCHLPNSCILTVWSKNICPCLLSKLWSWSEWHSMYFSLNLISQRVIPLYILKWPLPPSPIDVYNIYKRNLSHEWGQNMFLVHHYNYLSNGTVSHICHIIIDCMAGLGSMDCISLLATGSMWILQPTGHAIVSTLFVSCNQVCVRYAHIYS